MSEARYYGVSTGDGNNGVSHMFADYYVKTSEPWRLAELAALSEFKKGEGQEWARENMQIDGEEDYTISVVFYESKETQDERAEMQERLDAMDEDSDEAQELYDDIESFGCDSAWFIVEIFPEDDMREGRPVYESLEDAFGKDVMELVAAE